jgi:hypothetical protein
VTPYTSYLALEPGAAPQNVVAPMRNGRRGSGGDLGMRPPAPKAADAVTATGQIAVQESKRAREKQESLRADKETPSSVVRSAKGKTFYLRDKIWTDSEFNAQSGLPETRIKFGSDEYFELLKSKPALGPFFALGEEVVVVFQGRVYRVEAATP